MKIPKEAIEKAIEGGWKERFGDSRWSNNTNQVTNQVKVWNYEAIALDKTFWVALGKSLGWKTVCNTNGHYCQLDMICNVRDMCDGVGIEHWNYQAHRFYDLILQEKDPAAFWNELLTK